MNAKQLISHFNMVAHPEGGHYVETYRSSDSFNTAQGLRSASSLIYFLLEKNETSHLHRIKSDEVWYFHLGDPLYIYEIDDNFDLTKTVLGADLLSGQKLQHVVKKNRWFASRSSSEFSLVSCSVSPGFDFNDFEMAVVEQFSQSGDEVLDLILK